MKEFIDVILYIKYSMTLNNGLAQWMQKNHLIKLCFLSL